MEDTKRSPALTLPLADRLDERALGVLRRAHRWAQRAGASCITNRVLLASFLDGKAEGSVARGALSGVPEQTLETVRRACLASVGEPTRFPLDSQACARAVIPALERATRYHEGPVGEEELFRAFCEVLPVGLAIALAGAGVDLTRWRDPEAPTPAAVWGSDHAEAAPGSLGFGDGERLDVGSFEQDAWAALGRAVVLCRRDRCREVRTPHLFSALLEREDGLLQRRLGSQRTRALQLVSTMVAPSEHPTTAPLLADTVRRVIKAASERARAQGKQAVRADDLALALLDLPAGVTQVLQRAGLNFMTN